MRLVIAEKPSVAQSIAAVLGAKSRHCTDEAIAERKTYSEEQKTFLVDYGLTIVKAIHELIK